ncbi:MAG: hypothetical protein ACRCUM_02335 [Mycoplasmoidaceae bacterium]
MKTFTNIFPTWEIWEQDIINPIKDDFNNPEWLGTEFEQRRIYNLLNDHLGDFSHNLKSDKLLKSKCKLIYIDKYPSKYNQDLNFAKLKWAEISNEFFRNFDENESEGSDETRIASTPDDITYSTDLDDLPINQSQRTKLKNKITGTQRNLAREFRAQKLANFNNTFIEFLSHFEQYFLNFKTSNSNENIDHASTQFTTGEYVSDVPYLGLQNQKDINNLVDNINDLINEFNDDISNKQDKLIAGDNITIKDNVISSTGGGGGTPQDVYTKDETNDLIDEKIDNIPDIEYSSEYAHQVIPFTGNDDFQKFLIETNTVASDYSDVYISSIDTYEKKEIDFKDENVRSDCKDYADFRNDNTNRRIDPIGPELEKLNLEKASKVYVDNAIASIPQGGVDQAYVDENDNKTFNAAVISSKLYTDNEITNIKVDTTNLVDKMSDETIGGVKTFAKWPKIPNSPRDNDDAANKKYVVDMIGSIRIDAYTKAENDALLELKSDKLDTYTKQETNTAINDSNTLTISYIDDELTKKVPYELRRANARNYIGDGSSRFIIYSNGIYCGNNTIHEVATPTSGNQATNKQYVDDKFAGILPYIDELKTEIKLLKSKIK